jgi:hypothetical protein
VQWLGLDSGPSRRKLWALLIGFSGAPDDSGGPLRFAHEDAINFARFLQLDHDGVLPGKTIFDDVEIRLLLAAPGLDLDTLFGNPKIKILQNLGDARFRLISPGPKRYDDLVRNGISEILQSVRRREDWEDVILIYFSGHGFSRYVPREEPYTQLGLITPDANRELDQGVVWFDKDLMDPLRNSKVVSLIIIDACSTEIDGVEGFSSERTALKLPIYQDASVHGRTVLQFLFGSDVGKTSYEQSDYSVEDFVPNIALWPSDVRTKGSGVFSLGLLTSLLCQEAAKHQSYTFQTSSNFLNDHFFQQSNSKWRTGIRPKIEDTMKQMNLPFDAPHPIQFGFPGGDLFVTPLRAMSPTDPRCGL